MEPSKSAVVLTDAAPRPATAVETTVTFFPTFVIPLPIFSSFPPTSPILVSVWLVLDAWDLRRFNSASVSAISLCNVSYCA